MIPFLRLHLDLSFIAAKDNGNELLEFGMRIGLVLHEAVLDRE
jgi:hypothetical protein